MLERDGIAVILMRPALITAEGALALGRVLSMARRATPHSLTHRSPRGWTSGD